MEALGNPALSDLARNLIAAALVNQEGADQPALAAAFADMVADERENMRWRQYALQHLANLSSGPAQGACMAALERLAVSDHGPLGGTALLQLHRREEDGVSLRTNAIDDILTSSLLANSFEVTHRITCIGLAAERGRQDLAPIIRQMAKRGDATSRVAIRALGQIGDHTDIALVTLASKSGDLGLAAAGMQALEALHQREAGNL